MDYTTLGATGLRVSVAGLGCGGSARLGMPWGKSKAESVAIVRQTIDLGVNFLDTAAAYGTEPIVGAALAQVPRASVVVATKATIQDGDRLLSAQEVTASLDRSLRALGTDYIDLFQLHGVRPSAYDHAVEKLVPALLQERDKGKLRHLGITESPPNDPRHLVLQRAVHHGRFETMMLAFHMMNQSARETVFPAAQANRVGTIVMFAVRSLFSVPGRLQQTLRELAAAGRVPGWLAGRAQPLDFLIRDGGASSVIDAAYRYARHQPGVDVVLFGTGNLEHLRSNVASILKPPLPAADTARLNELFGALEGIGLDVPIRP
jgi:aryl-alcohol dehydrogenase-like predicted oxidoreductase